MNTLEIPGRWPEGAGQYFSWLLRRLGATAAAADYVQLFEVITCSAEYNQFRLPLPGFAELRRLAAESHAGVLIAHSGTIAGLLTRPEAAAELLPRLEKLAASLRTPGQRVSPVYTEHYHSIHHQTLCTVFPAR